MQQPSQFTNLYLLVQVIDAGGLSAAARQLGMTRSMVSRRLMALESELGVRLLHRDARHFIVTPAGEKVYRHALVMCDAAQAATEAARDSDGAHSAQIRIGMDDALQTLATEIVPAFSAQHPGVRLAVGSGDVSALVKQRVDVVFSAADAADRADVVSQRLVSLRWIVVASPALLQRLDHPRHPDQLTDRNCLNYGIADWNLRGTMAHPRQPQLVSSHLPTLLAMARAGLGFVQAPMHACHDDLSSGSLCETFEAFETIPRPLYALRRAEPDAGQAALRFIAFVKDQLTGMGDRGVITSH